MQRADSFAIGSGTRESKDIDELEDFDKKLDSAVHKIKAEPGEDAEEQVMEEHRDREKKAELEAQRRGSSSPSHQPFLGMSILPGISNPSLAVGNTGEAYSKRRSGQVESGADERIEAVSHDLVAGLRAAGLENPVITLDDPRLGGGAEGLKADYVFSLSGSERVYVWDQGGCHQKITIGFHSSKIESAVGEVVETLTRKGKTDEKVVSRRAASEGDFRLGDEDLHS